MKLLLADIRIDGNTQQREGIIPDVVREYSDDMTEGDVFAPVVVFYDGVSHWLADGYHRYHAACLAGFVDIEAEVRRGTLDEAIDYACSKEPNGRHGLRETPEGRRNRVRTMLRRHPSWSNVQIAEHCGVSHQTVGRVASDMSTGQVERPAVRIGQDGRTINTANIGRASAPSPAVDEIPLGSATAEGRSPPEEEPDRHYTPDTEAPPARPYTPPAKAITDIRNYIDVVLDELESDNSRHVVAADILKYIHEQYRKLDQKLNQSA